MTEGVVRDVRLSVSHMQQRATSMDHPKLPQSKALFLTVQRIMSVRVDLSADVRVSLSTLEQNFYTTSSWETFLIIAVAIHLIGIGLFFVWMAAGQPIPVQELKTWWTKVRILPVRH
jgi:hypothetical protein